MDIHQPELIIVSLLLFISLIAMVARRTRVPYTVALVLAGLAVAVANVLPQVQITPGLILLLFLPPLIFEAAFHLDFGQLMENRRHIAALAMPGPVLSAILIGAVLHLAVAMDLPSALLFGALISATDPMSVLAIFKELGVPRRLAYLVEGESLFNDAVAIVLYRVLVLMIATGQFSLVGNIVRFVVVAVGGGVLGLIGGYLFSLIVRRIDDHLIEITLTTVLAYGTYLLADSLNLSGVIAVVVAGVVAGNYATRMGMSPTTQITLSSFWEYVTFIANSFVFLLIGMRIDVFSLAQNLYPILWAVAAVLAARALIVYGMSLFGRYLTSRPLSMSWRHVLFWGGLRGSLSVAVALSIPITLQSRDTILVMTFGVVLFSVVVQGLTMRPLLGLLHMVGAPKESREYEYTRGRLSSSRAARGALQQMWNEGLISKPVFDELSQRYDTQSRDLAQGLATLQEQSDVLRQEEFAFAMRRCLLVERSTLEDLHRQGMIGEEAYQRLIAEIDGELQEIE
jgi:CPA1 family monovalent cation:H+ antiporter